MDQSTLVTLIVGGAGVVATVLGSIVAGLMGIRGTLKGVEITQKHADNEAREKERFAYIEQQVTQFYGPIVGIKRRIDAGRAVQKKIFDFVKAEHDDGNEQHAKKRREEAAFAYQKGRFARELEGYKEILSIFTTRPTLPEPATQADFQALVELANFCAMCDGRS